MITVWALFVIRFSLQVVLQIAAEAARAILHSFPDYAIMTVGEKPVNAVDGGGRP